MRMVRRWSAFIAIAACLGLNALTVRTASASSLIQYSTSGSIDATGVTGTPVISYDSLTKAAFNSPSFLSLGDFQVAGLPAGESTTYNSTPFHITLVVNKVDGTSPTVNGTPIVLNGTLDGKITGSKQSTVKAYFDPIGTKTFQLGNLSASLTLPATTEILVPSTTNNGITTAEARLRTVPLDNPIPEPTSIALFLTTLAGLGLRRRFRVEARA